MLCEKKTGRKQDDLINLNKFMVKQTKLTAIKCSAGKLSSGILSPKKTINGKIDLEQLLEKVQQISQANPNYFLHRQAINSI